MKILIFALFLVQIGLIWSKNHAAAHRIDHPTSSRANTHRYKYEYEAHHDKSLPFPFHTQELHQDDDGTRSLTHSSTHSFIYSLALPGRIDSKKRTLAALDSEMTPLYQGYGTHFSYVYVGTPPQRQSVIIGTSIYCPNQSHYSFIRMSQILDLILQRFLALAAVNAVNTRINIGI